MEKYKDMFAKILEESNITIENLDRIIQKLCYRAISEIAKVIRLPQLDYGECFLEITKIIESLKSIGLDTDFKHDFG